MKPPNKIFPYLLLAGILLNANGLLNDILEPDGAIYATISKHIALSGDWVNLFSDGHDWLDKPHLPFWIAAASFKVFGITAFAYKLPAFIFWLAGIWYTFSFAREFYNSYTARVAVLVYVFALHGILNNFDVRAEPYLTTLVMAAMWYFYKATVSGKWIHIVLTAFTIACAVMTKGIFVLLTIGSGFIIYWAITSQWRQFAKYKWWLMLLLVLLFITPELYSLYVQFDLHPEKTVFDQTHVSGLRFFFWDSQFGRFFNTGPIKGHGDISFFLHTTLWAFLPWSVMLYIAVYRLISRRSASNDKRSWIIYGSAAATFLLFSFSRFQLPHYIVILFPHFAIITAAYLANIKLPATYRKWSVFLNVLLVVAVVFVCLLCWYSGFGNAVVVVFISLAITIAAMVYKKEGIDRIIVPGAAISIMLFVFLNNFFYPALLKYQAGMMAGKWLTANLPRKNTAMLGSWSTYSFEFYAPGMPQKLETTEQLNDLLLSDNSAVIATNNTGLSRLQKDGYSYQVLQQFYYFHISMLTGKFLNPATRPAELEPLILVKVGKLPGAK